MKRTLCWILVLAMVLSLPVNAQEWVNPFSDVQEGQWYYEGVRFVTEANLFSGMSSTTFGPHISMNRAMLVTVLWRYAGKPTGGRVSYSDVPRGQWYTEAISWAGEIGLVNGVGNGRFSPNGNVTREQLATILFRYADHLGVNTDDRANLTGFTDRWSISSYAVDSFQWAVANGLIAGMTAQNGALMLAPQGNATRAQVATMIARFVRIVQGEDLDTNVPAPAPENGMTAGANTLMLGMSKDELTSLCGAPEEILPAYRGFDWYVYGTKTYKNFYMAGVAGETVVALCAAGVGFSYLGAKAGDRVEFPDSDAVLLNVFTDSNDSDRLHCVLLIDVDFGFHWQQGDERAWSEAKVNYHLTNAFRVYHGSPILQWSKKGAESARLHCLDMSEHRFVGHTGSDGSSAGDRLNAQGIKWSTWGENVAKGCTDGLYAYDAWINSAPHRENLLSPAFTHMGVGISAEYGLYYTQVFYR